MNLLLCGHNKTHYSTAYTLLNTAFYYALFEKRPTYFCSSLPTDLFKWISAVTMIFLYTWLQAESVKKLCKYSDY